MWKLLFQWVGVPLACLLIGAAGGWKVHDWYEGAAETKAVIRTVAVVQKSDAATQTVALHQQAVQTKIEYVTRTIIEKVPEYVTPAADAACVVPTGFVRAYNAAVVSEVPTPPGKSDEAPSGVPISTVLATDVKNLGTGHSNTAVAKDWQTWYAEQEKIYDKN